MTSANPEQSKVELVLDEYSYRVLSDLESLPGYIRAWSKHLAGAQAELSALRAERDRYREAVEKRDALLREVARLVDDTFDEDKAWLASYAEMAREETGTDG